MLEEQFVICTGPSQALFGALSYNPRGNVFEAFILSRRITTLQPPVQESRLFFCLLVLFNMTKVNPTCLNIKFPDNYVKKEQKENCRGSYKLPKVF